MNKPKQPVLYRNTVTGRTYQLVDEVSGVCVLEGVDRRIVWVDRETLESPNSAWERQV